MEMLMSCFLTAETNPHLWSRTQIYLIWRTSLCTSYFTMRRITKQWNSKTKEIKFNRRKVPEPMQTWAQSFLLTSWRLKIKNLTCLPKREDKERKKSSSTTWRPRDRKLTSSMSWRRKSRSRSLRIVHLSQKWFRITSQMPLRQL